MGAYQQSGTELGWFKSANESWTRVVVYISLMALYILGGSKVKAVSATLDFSCCPLKLENDYICCFNLLKSFIWKQFVCNAQYPIAYVRCMFVSIWHRWGSLNALKSINMTGFAGYHYYLKMESVWTCGKS